MRSFNYAIIIVVISSIATRCDASMIVVDFESLINGVNTGTNWNVMTAPGTPLSELTTTSGDTTGVAITTTFSGTLAGSVDPSSLHANDTQLLQIDDVFIGPSASFPTITFTGLRPGETYSLALLGLQVLGDINDNNGQFVSANGNVFAYQDTGGSIGSLFINGNDGSPSSTLNASLINVNATNLGTLSITVGSGLSDVSWVAGV